MNHVVIHDNSPEYSPLLREIRKRPRILYARGDVSLLKTPCFAVVGTRACTPLGRTNARRLVRGLVSYGLTIVSGLAFGIDAVAHEMALECGGRTIAVLGNGIDLVRPAANEWLGNKILEEGGLIVSEHPPKTPVQAHYFLARNRIISGISIGALIVEAPIKSGALTTAQRAFEQNRDVFAVPGSLAQETMVGCNGLIANDVARLVRTPEDIIAHLKDQPELVLRPLLKARGEPRHTFTTRAQETIFRLVTNHPIHRDDLFKQADLTIPELSVALSYLEIQGIIKPIGYGSYVRA